MLDNPANSKKIAKIVDSNGELTVKPGRYSRNAIAIAFDLIGGVEAFSDWADENKSEFYTKIFPKIVGKEIELGLGEGVEELLDLLDAGVDKNAEVVDADYEVIEEPISEKTNRGKYSALADEYAKGEIYEDEEDTYED